MYSEIKQNKFRTIFQIEAKEWNNVPKIVYEAVCQIVTKYDTHYAYTLNKHASIDRDISKCRSDEADLDKKIDDQAD